MHKDIKRIKWLFLELFFNYRYDVFHRFSYQFVIVDICENIVQRNHFCFKLQMLKNNSGLD